MVKVKRMGSGRNSTATGLMISAGMDRSGTAKRPTVYTIVPVAKRGKFPEKSDLAHLKSLGPRIESMCRYTLQENFVSFEFADPIGFFLEVKVGTSSGNISGLALRALLGWITLCACEDFAAKGATPIIW